MVKVHLYRPFSNSTYYYTNFAERICVLDRTKEPGSTGEPLYLDVRNAFFDVENAPMIIGEDTD